MNIANVMNPKLNKKIVIWIGIIHFTHLEYGTPASPNEAINIPDVGKIAFENPSPNWNIKTDNCL